MLKIIAIGCIHGKLQKKTLSLIKSEKPDAILISGDLSGGDFAHKLMDYERSLIENFGPIVEFWPLKVQVESEKKFQKWSKLSALNTKKVFTELKKTKVPIFYIHGNWDSVALNKTTHFEGSGNFFIDKVPSSNMKFIHNKIISIKGYTIIGFGGYRGTSGKEYLYKDLPQPLPELKYVLKLRNEIKNKMDNLFKHVKNERKIILLTHDPPYKTFDYLKSAKKFYGEKITRDLIRKHKPLVCICSHFHEHRGKKKIGNTTVIATGYGHSGQACVLEFDDQKIKTKFVG